MSTRQSFEYYVENIDIPYKTPTEGVAMFKHKEDTLEPDNHALLNPLRRAEVVRLGQGGWELASTQPLVRGVTETGNQNAQDWAWGIALSISYLLFLRRATSQKNTPSPRRVSLVEWNQGDRQADRTLICKRFAVNTPRPSLRRSCLAVLTCSVLVAQGAFAASASEQTNLEVIIQQLNALEDTVRRSAQSADEPRQRFYFDYSRLAIDLQRVHQSLQDYMIPSHTQPRGPSDLPGNYTLRGRLVP